MKICSKCGTQNQDNAMFCGGCGGSFQAPPVEQAAQPVQPVAPVQPVQPIAPAPQYVPEQQYARPADPAPQYTAPAPVEAPVEKFDEEDVKLNKAMGILSYVIGPLVLIPCFLTKHSPYTRFHNNQGLIITIAAATYSLIKTIIMAILGAILPFSYLYGISTKHPAYIVFDVLLSIGYLAFVALIVFGIISAIKGTKNELPLVGKIKIFK